MTADEPMSTPDSEGLPQRGEVWKWAWLTVTIVKAGPKRVTYDTSDDRISSPTDRFLTRFHRTRLAAHPEPVPTPDSADDATVGERELMPTEDKTPEVGMGWRDGLDSLDALLNDCAQDGKDWQHHVRVSAVRDIVAAIRRFEDNTDEDIRQALWEDAVTEGEAWAMGDER